MKLTRQWNLRKRRMEGTFYSIVIRIHQKEGSNSRQWFMSYIWLYCNCYVLKLFACCVFSLYTCSYVTSAIQHRKWNVDKLLPNRSATSRDHCSIATCIWTIVSCFFFFVYATRLLQYWQTWPRDQRDTEWPLSLRKRWAIALPSLRVWVRVVLLCGAAS